MALEPKKRKPLTRDNPLHDLQSGDLAPHRQCPAMSKRTGERCKNMLSVGKRTCRMHGSATTKSKMAAAKRIAKASGYAADMLVEFMADPSVDVKLRTQIAQDLLDRANVSGKTAISLELPEWEKRMQDSVVTAAVVDWSELAALKTPDRDPNVIDAEVVEDDAHEREWDRRLEAPRETPTRQRPSDFERRMEALPVKPPSFDDKVPLFGDEGGTQTARRLADEHRKAAFAAEREGRTLTPRTTRRRK